MSFDRGPGRKLMRGTAEAEEPAAFATYVDRFGRTVCVPVDPERHVPAPPPGRRPSGRGSVPAGTTVH